MEPFKELLNLKNAEIIAQSVKKHYVDFDVKKFCSILKTKLPQLELKERMKVIASILSEYLPKDPKLLFPILIQSAKSLNGFQIMPLTHLVATYGLNNVELSMNALYNLTKNFTGEFAIRPFLINHETNTLKILTSWLNDSCPHVRRLISEGTRPLLPWGEKIPAFVQNPEKTWHLIDALKNDPSDYVRKSVANHINDHSKNNAKWLLQKIRHWNHQKDPQLTWIVKHGLRTLIKQGNTDCLKLLGINTKDISIVKFSLLTIKVTLGEKIQSQLLIKNNSSKDQIVIVDHQVALLKKNKKHLNKVFKGIKVLVKAKSTQKVHLSLVLKKVTTRTYYPGIQHYCLKVNGQNSMTKKFTLV